MFTFLLLWSPIIMILIALVVFNASKSDLTLKNHGLVLIKNSIKYASTGEVIVFLYSFFRYHYAVISQSQKLIMNLWLRSYFYAPRALPLVN